MSFSTIKSGLFNANSISWLPTVFSRSSTVLWVLIFPDFTLTVLKAQNSTAWGKTPGNIRTQNIALKERYKVSIEQSCIKYRLSAV
jgi:hypothetical protein